MLVTLACDCDHSRRGCFARRSAPARAPMSDVLTPSQKKREAKLRSAKAKARARSNE